MPVASSAEGQGMSSFARRVTLFAVATAVAAATAVVATPFTTHASAQSLLYWTGTVSSVDDGDTEYIDVAGDGKGPVPIRNANIQATENPAAGNRPECHAADATNYMKAMLTPGRKVRLSAYSAS